MKFNNRKNLILIVSVVVIVAAAVIFNWANKANSGVAEGEVEFSVTVADWVKEGIESSDSAFNQKYVGKTVEISGKVAEVSEIHSSNSTNVKLESGQEEVIVGALFNKTYQEVHDLKVGQDVTLICECNGVSKPEEDDLISEILFTLKHCQIKK